MHADTITISAIFVGALIVPPLLYILSTFIYNITLHPLRRFPGPLLSAGSILPLSYHRLRGDYVFWLRSLHNKYGQKVRVAPNEISYIASDAWKDIYGHRSYSKTSSLQKPLSFYGKDMYTPPGKAGLIRANDIDHARQRRLCSAGFSDKSMKAQEPLLRNYVNILISKLAGLAATEAKVDIVSWFNFTTFDIMSDLTFGEKMGLLDNSSYTDWVASIFQALKFIIFTQVFMQIPVLNKVLPRLIPASYKQQREKHRQYAVDRVDKRLAMKTDRPDIWTYILRFQESEQNLDRGLTIEEMYSNSATFMSAGTETTASLLSGLTYLLLQHPEKHQRLVAEIRDAFPTSESINLAELSRLEYFNACLDEALRFYPPVPTGMPRITSAEGAVICGDYVPPNTLVYVSQYVAYRSPLHFRHPDTYLPERWLKASRFEDDNVQILQPFSVGPRSCLGKNLAYHEMRLVLSSILWHFDLELCEESREWMRQKVFGFWEKPALMVRLRGRR